MKTLGQIAYESHRDYFTGDDWGHDDCEVCKGAEQAKWEAAAQAVRAAVIEECALELENMPNHNVEDYTVQRCTEAIRSLK